MKFWKYSWILALILVIVLVVTLIIVWRPSEEEDVEIYGQNAFYLDYSVADDDERLTQSFVNNSMNEFFLRGTPLQNELFRENSSQVQFAKTFYDRYLSASKPRNESLPGTLRKIRITTPVSPADEEGAIYKEKYEIGQEFTLYSITEIEDELYYQVGKNKYVDAACADRVLCRTALEGTLSHPFTVNVDRTQYLEFSGAGDYVYLRFFTDSQFVSLFLEDLPAGSSWELYDQHHRKIGARYAGTRTTEEVYYKALSSGEFLLKINSAGAAASRLVFHQDDNSWQENMQTVTLEQKFDGVLDFYGDEDFCILNNELMQDINGLYLELDSTDAALHLTAYNQSHEIIGRYTGEKGKKENISLYGMGDMYCLSVRTSDGKAVNCKYSLKVYYTDIDLLGLETFGFKISSPLDISSGGENYYTAVCNGLTGKRITDVQTLSKTTVTMNLVTSTGASYNLKEGDELPLSAGKNTLSITIKNQSQTRVLKLILTDMQSYQLCYGFILQGGAKLYESSSAGSKTIAILSGGTKVLCLGVYQNAMVKVELSDGSGKKGWVQESKIFDDYTTCPMPSVYASAIQQLQKKHPNWKFTFVRVGQTLEEAVTAETKENPIIYTSGGWKSAGREQIEYYMDPQNFLNEQDIFMFEKQTYHAGTYSENGVKATWTEKEGALASEDFYTQCFLEAGKSAGLSPYFIAARASLESGNGTSNLAKGVCKGYEGYYNFYGINAVDSNPIQGAAFAKNHNWYTQRIAIIEGAVWIKDQYISVLQYTPYFIKYSFVPGRKWHQYMTDIKAPVQDAAGCYKAHLTGGTLNSAIEFVIPVFDGV